MQHLDIVDRTDNIELTVSPGPSVEDQSGMGFPSKQTNRIIVPTIADAEKMMDAASNRHPDGTLNADWVPDVMVDTVESVVAFDFSVTSGLFESTPRRGIPVESNCSSASLSSS
jgi:hypothetical protein